MALAALATSLLLQVAAAAPAPPPPAHGGARPAECAKADGGSGTNTWERAKSPELRAYCERLAAATSQLVGSGAVSLEVLALAEAAIKARPEKAPAYVLRGRALVRMGRHAEALAAFEEARRRDERALDEPRALFAWAHGNARAGHPVEALAAFRALLPRASRLDAEERGAAYVETGLLLLRGGPKDLDEAIAVLRAARHEAQESVQVVAVLALGLALDRWGEHEQARALVAEHAAKPKRSEVALADTRSREVLACADPGDELALRGVLLEVADPARALEAYRASLEKSPQKPWEAQTKRRIEALSASGAKKAPPKAAR